MIRNLFKFVDKPNAKRLSEMLYINTYKKISDKQMYTRHNKLLVREDNCMSEKTKCLPFTYHSFIFREKKCPKTPSYNVGGSKLLSLLQLVITTCKSLRKK